MRVLTFIHSFEPGGVERVALRLVREWRARGIDAPLFVGRPDGAMREDVGSGLDHAMPHSRPSWLARRETLWMLLTLPRAVRRLRPDVLFCAGNTYTIIAVALKLLLGAACPPIVAKVSNDLDRHDLPLVARLAYRWWVRASARFLDHVVATEGAVADEVVERLGLPRRAVSVIPNPVLAQAQVATLRAQAAATPGRVGGRRFVAVGRLARQKNLPLLLRAFAAGAAPADTLTLVGDGPERAALVWQARALGLARQVTFLGYVADPAAILYRYHALLLSSDYEGVPAAILEALAANLAVVATDCSRSIAGLLDHGAVGVLVAPGDVVGLARAIREVVPGTQDPTRSLAICERFVIEANAHRFVDVMRRTILTAAPLPIRPLPALGRDYA